MKHKLLAIVLIIALCMGLSISTYAYNNLSETPISTVDLKIQVSFEEFIESFDRVANTPNCNVYVLSDFFCDDLTEEGLVGLYQSYASALEKQSYVEQKKSLEQTNLKRTYEFKSVPEVSNELVHIRVGVTRTWKYATINHLDSGSYDEYDVWYNKELDGWKIAKIEGTLDIAQNNRLSSIGLDINDITDLKCFAASTDVIVQNYIREFDEFNIKLSNETPSLILNNYNNEIQPRATTYNRGVAVNYATTYALSPNPAYPTFPLDCTNFTSQCLVAGNIAMHTGGEVYGWDTWYIVNVNNFSSAWTEANTFNYYLSSPSCKINNTITNYEGCALGDIIQINTDTLSSTVVSHSTILTGFQYPEQQPSDRGDLFVCCHTTNRRNCNLYSIWGGKTMVYHHILGRK